MKDFSLFDLLSWYLVFLFSMVLHEASHAFAAWKLGDSTAYQQGQVTLDPTPHIKREPFGTVLVPLASFFSSGWMIGWASAPYDPRWAAAYPKRSALMAAAGPTANLVIFLVAFTAMKIGLAANIFTTPLGWDMAHIVVAEENGWPYIAARFLSIAFSLNFILFVFNLIPVPPLDGSSMVKFLLPDSACRSYDSFIRTPGFALGGILVAWWIFPQIGRPLLQTVVQLLG
jgi:Zn-dependent protease